LTRQISSTAWRALSQRLGVEEPTLKAVAEVESAGSGFAPPPSEEPKILFEGHAFHRLTQGRYSSDPANRDISYPKWTKQFYAKTQTGEWDRLTRARALDRDAAHQAASWGAFQIMGFNYGLCGFSNVESFVAAQRAGADEQLDAFAQFIARESFLAALRTHDWKTFAAKYNGPGYAQNQYDTRLAAAFARHSAAAGAAPAGARRAGRPRRLSAIARPIGRPEFAMPPAEPRKTALSRSVKPDAVDLRDWLYRPTIAAAPPFELWPYNPRPTTDQKTTSACTGFALGKVIEYLLERARRPVEPVSGYMLYSMARRYDEWSENDEKDEGSSLRGALKGWSRHGASAARLWTEMEPSTPTNAEGDWWLDSVKRPMGAYYRLTLDALTDIHTALMESGAVYASAFTHGGWEELFAEAELPPPTSADEIPVIECRRGLENAGHAFAIVGYTSKGFVVHNSWGPVWGRGGFGILTYSDWRQNAMDAWVVQLGVVTKEHEEVAKASSLRVTDNRAGRVVISSNATLSVHEVSPFVIDMQNEGRLSDRGQFRTFDTDLAFLLDHHLNDVARERWQLKNTDTVDVAIYAHGGLVDESSAADSARRWIPLLYSNQIFPVFLMWETDLLSTVFNNVEDMIKGDQARAGAEWWNRFKTRVRDWKDERIEGLTRAPGRILWREMNENAQALSSAPSSGVSKLFDHFQKRRRKLPKVRLHLIGHSAGAIVHAYLGNRALAAGFEIASVNLIAPAVRIGVFDECVGAKIAASNIRVLIVHLTDAAEQADPSCSPYGRSLLYLVSRAFESVADTPILGMEKHLVPALVSHEWGPKITRLASPGVAYRPGDRLTVATTHGGLDDDYAVQDGVIRHIKGKGGRVYRPTQTSARKTDADVEPDETGSIEADVIAGMTKTRRPG
jgi:N-acetylmuramidase-like protein